MDMINKDLEYFCPNIIRFNLSKLLRLKEAKVMLYVI